MKTKDKIAIILILLLIYLTNYSNKMIERMENYNNCGRLSPGAGQLNFQERIDEIKGLTQTEWVVKFNEAMNYTSGTATDIDLCVKSFFEFGDGGIEENKIHTR
tara:strand:- start:705 stop:1016 length:312 start_codon:yes stop_codon:yes gene_type:complete